MSLAPFIHLRVHSSYSLLEGAIKPDEMVSLCHEHRMPAIAICDTNNLFGILEFSSYAQNKGIKPIIGVTLALARPQASPTAQIILDQIVLYAKDEIGYQHLLKLVSIAYTENMKDGKPHITFLQLANFQEGLIALTAGIHGTVGKLLLAEERDQAIGFLLEFKRIFDDRLYIELSRHGLQEERKIEPQLLALAHEHDIPIVATNEIFYIKRDMTIAHDVLLCIAEGRYVLEEDRRKLSKEHYFKSPEEMVKLFADLPEAIANTIAIAKRCSVLVPKRKPIFPKFDTRDGQSEQDELREQAAIGLEERLVDHVFTKDQTPEDKESIAKPYRDRLAFELDVIIGMGFSGYFLIVSDFMRWSKRQYIPVGPGRGSGAGSVVAWSLQITDLDPLRFGLLFERFLNPERVSMPDFDIDFCQDRRGEVIRYVQQKYGYDHVAQIITFGKLQARAVLRDVGRVLQLPLPVVDRICKLVPNNPAAPVTLAEAIGIEPELKKAQLQDPEVSKMISIALQLEGLNRHASVHAAGVVIGDRPLDQLLPLYCDPRSDMPVVQFSMKYAEESGLVKFDFLGLKTLTVIDKTVDLIAAQHPDQTRLSIDSIPLDDPRTFEMLSKGDAVGVFQLEGNGMRDTLRKLKPDTLEEVIALISLYRPGPMDNIPTYIARKQGMEAPDYYHPSLESILKETFGVIIYQEQVMQIAQTLSGYTLGGADLLRRAMGKKIKAEMDQQRKIFVDGAVNNGVDAALADSIFDVVAKFAGYGFNKSHAAAYALISYQTAWLKANYPVEFLAATMNLEMHDTDKLNLFRQEANLHDILVLPPDINASASVFTVETITHEDGSKTKAIRYGLGAIKSVGPQAMEEIVKLRTAQGAFSSIYHLADLADAKLMNRRQIEFLIKAGAFDTLHPNRNQLFQAIDQIIHFNQNRQREKESKQQNLFAILEQKQGIQHPNLPVISDWNMNERLEFEHDALGFYLSSHPLSPYGRLLEALEHCHFQDLLARAPNGHSQVTMAALVVERRIRVSPKGRFAYIALSDPSGNFECAVFDSELLDSATQLLQPGQKILLSADLRKEEGSTRLIMTSVAALDHALNDIVRKLTISITDSNILGFVQETLTRFEEGNTLCTLNLHFQDGYQVAFALPRKLHLTPSNITLLETSPCIDLKVSHC